MTDAAEKIWYDYFEALRGYLPAAAVHGAETDLFTALQKKYGKNGKSRGIWAAWDS